VFKKVVAAVLTDEFAVRVSAPDQGPKVQLIDANCAYAVNPDVYVEWIAIRIILLNRVTRF
jgi:hypothetical protein